MGPVTEWAGSGHGAVSRSTLRGVERLLPVCHAVAPHSARWGTRVTSPQEAASPSHRRVSDVITRAQWVPEMLEQLPRCRGGPPRREAGPFCRASHAVFLQTQDGAPTHGKVTDPGRLGG